MNHKQKMTDAREVAFLALLEGERQNAWSDDALKRRLDGLDSRDSALATRLSFGVLQNKRLLDFYIAAFSNHPLKKMERAVLIFLRLAVYQILFMDKIPQSAAVDSAVSLTKKHCKHPKASGMVNGILRNFIRQLDNLPEIPQDDPIEALGIQYSHPNWLVGLFADEVSKEELPLLLEANNRQPPITAMVNTVLSSRKEVTTSLESEGVSVEVHPWLDDCLILRKTGNIERLTAFKEGLFYIQDPASRLAVECSGVQSGETVLDTCAAPGGKSMALAIKMGNQGSITSCDLHDHKQKHIVASATRLKLDCITPKTVSAKDFTADFYQGFDLVFVDAPCSGLGVIAKKPDIREKEEAPLKGLPEIQCDILENVSQYVKIGGTLLYSTCTILKRENQEIVLAFLEKHPEFSLESFTLPHIGYVTSGMMTLYPHKHETDGFFMAKMKRSH